MPARALAQGEESVEPYFLVMVDTSGSMGLGGAGGNIYNSCGMPPSRINAAKCVLGDVFSSFGDADFGLGRFQMDCFSGPVYATASCDGDSANMGEVVVPISGDNLSQLSSFVDFFPDYPDPTGLSCPDEDPPELVVNDGNFGLTPLAGTLNAARRYYQGNDPVFGTSPIATDPFRGCRQYYVILLTDGDETCADLDDVEDAAAALRSTNVPGVGTFDIRTYVIGFGVPDGDDNIEAIATAGGTTALFAQDEASLSLAFAQVIQDSLVNEVCNNADDDCDGNVDEGFQKYCDLDGTIGPPTGNLDYCTPVPDDCDEVDDNCFLGTSDEPKNACGFCGPVPAETCNLLDDDCDDNIDEGNVCGGCTPTGAEACNNLDEDCDGNIDEGLTRPCGTDVGECVAGEEQCVAGQWVGCDAVGPQPEACDGLDNDCDGNVDGFAEECVEIPDNGPPFDGVCQPGIRVCPSDGSGQFGPCLGEVGPTDEACDLEDDDCDGTVDEDTGGADCSSDCGVGVTECVGGVLECNAQQTPMPEECNNFDDDCDGTVDEEIPSGGPCDEGGTLCVPGELQCIAGEMQCVGGEEPLPEICDCEDNDCDGTVDEPGVCPPGSACVNCQCATACGDEEFPCPVGFICEEGYCVTDPCFGITCPPTEDGLQACKAGMCVPVCDTVTCPQGLACHPSDGSCRTDDCIGFPERCAEDELCVGGTCEPDPCAGVECPGADEYCLEGDCVVSCGGVTCPEGQRCELGACTPDRCADVKCLSNQFCDPDTGTCVDDKCRDVFCRQGQTCDPSTGECIKEPCLGVECPGDEVCSEGSCFDPSAVGPDGGLVDHEYVSAGGGGGCSAAGGGTGPAALLLALLALAPLLRRRPRAELAATALFAAAAAAGAGCQSDGYCITCIDPAAGDGGPTSDSGPAADADTPGDGGPIADACPISGVEQCDGLDNDCDGTVDEGDLDGEGIDCGTDVGECSPGTTECVGGEIVCGGGAVLPVQESCDMLDNDCDGTVDEGSPGAGLICGTNQGDCVAGVTACVDGEIVCQGQETGSPETCDGRDNDCDGAFDEDVPTGGSCGPNSDLGICEFGTMACIGGQMQCSGAVFPQVELCDAIDQDCDGDPINGFDLDNDSQNCGACGNVCQAPNAVAVCDGSGNCVIGACAAGYWDLPPFDYADGCEYRCDFQGSETCNQEDDDCDGAIDEDLVPPQICDPHGECAAGGGPLTPECTAEGWVCNYGPTVETDAEGNIVPETRCDGLDNDCDGATDEAFPTLGQTCDDGELGACRETGAFVCNQAGDGVVCSATDSGADEGTEACNNLDDDCDGDVDEGDVNEWVDIGGVEVFAYEASRPDATAASAGGVTAYPCSRPGVLPWTNVTHPEAEAACQAIGARLCSEEEWQLACELAAPPAADPAPQDPGPDGLVVIEAEDFSDNIPYDPSGPTNDRWVFENTRAGYSGTGYMFGSPDNNDNSRDPPNSPRLDFDVNFVKSGTHYLWIRGYADESNDDRVHAGIDGDWDDGGPGDQIGNFSPTAEWVWVNYNSQDVRVTLDVPSAGVHTVNIWMREDGFRIDKILLTSNPSYIPSGEGPTGTCTWAYATDCTTYQPSTCNGDEYDTGTAPGDQDALVPTSELAMCYADWGPAGQIHDLSGNVREWTQERAPGENPMRGGAYNSTASGLRCDHDFLLADDDFFFPNVGFRCCR